MGESVMVKAIRKPKVRCRKFHVCVDLRDILATWNAAQYFGFLQDKDGNKLSSAEARRAVVDLVAKGVFYLPFEECDKFSAKTGCRGHVVAEGRNG